MVWEPHSNHFNLLLTMCKVLSCVLGAMQVFMMTGFCQSDSSIVMKLLDTATAAHKFLQPAGAETISSVDRLPHSIVQRRWQVPLEKQRLTARSIVIPSAMIAYGALTFTSRDLKRLNLAVRDELWEDRNNGHGKAFHIDNFSLVAPAVAVYALNIAGVKGKNNLVDASLMYGMSHLIGQVLIVSNVKKLSSIMRPDSSNRLSFPSGHTAQAFISAEFLRREYKDVSPWIGVAGYAVAVGTGFLRMYNNKHWLNDVIAGAGVGILSTHISYWLYPKIKSTFLGKWKGNTIVAPTYRNRSFGFGMVHKF